MKYIVDDEELNRIKKTAETSGYDEAFKFFERLVADPTVPIVFGGKTSEQIKKAVFEIKKALIYYREKL